MNKTVDDINQIRLTIFKALADPVRIRIINFLKTKEHEIACGVVAKEINISKSSGTYHFKLLQQADLINVRKEAREKYVTLNTDTFHKYITDFFGTEN